MNELKFCEDSWNSFSKRSGKFQLSILKNKNILRIPKKYIIQAVVSKLAKRIPICCPNFPGRFWSYLYRPNRHYGLMLLFRAREEYDKASQLSNFRRSRDASMNHLRESTMEKFRGIEERESEWVQIAMRWFLCIYVSTFFQLPLQSHKI